jgi:hypothetical protein
MRAVGLLLFLLAAAGCGTAGPGAPPGAGVEGVVTLGPQCPVEQEGVPCPAEPPAGVPVIVSERIPGELYAPGPEVARTTTDAKGAFRVDVAPGEYVVTAEAGMSCELMDVTVVAAEHVRVTVPCDTGIR